MDHGLVKSARAAGVWREEWPEYRLVVPAEDPVSRQVWQLRAQWEEVYGAASVSGKPPGITLACFRVREEMEETVIRWTRNLAERVDSFVVTLNNFSGIPPQLVYIRVQDDVPFRQIAAHLRSMLEVMGDHDGSSRVFERPFIKLGAFPEEGRHQQWLAYTHQLFHAAFTAKRLMLFRQDGGNGKMISVFPFKNNIVC